ncbi:type VI secretion system baseplate subunit TssE [Enterobacteriaceae bacterium 4M9]|nr:type VI secretion system baseplate subunit TssE [Enterobacteriaceae bacterium 4M9]
MMKHKVFYPCLMNRLLDEEPKSESEPWDKFHYNARTMRLVVKKNIEEILNNINSQEQLELPGHSEIASSVFNFGISPLAGEYATPQNHVSLVHRVREALIRFEPRLIPESIIVRQPEGSAQRAHYGVLLFEIRGLIRWGEEIIDLSLGASYDTEISNTILKLNNG